MSSLGGYVPLRCGNLCAMREDENLQLGGLWSEGGIYAGQLEDAEAALAAESKPQANPAGSNYGGAMAPSPARVPPMGANNLLPPGAASVAPSAYAQGGGVPLEQPVASEGLDFYPPGPGPGYFDPSFGYGGEQDVEAAGHLLGASVVVVVALTLVGMKYGGPYGGVAGSAAGGGVVNAYRALRYFQEGTDESTAEATVSGTYALVAFGLAALVAHKLATPPEKPYKANAEEPPTDELGYASNSGRCGIRPVGPVRGEKIG